MTKVVYLLGSFVEDNRTSMDLYLSQIYRSESNYEIRKFIPKALKFRNIRWINFQLLNKFNRYIYYPIQIFSLKADIYHITDHCYSHLIFFLPKNKVIVTVHDIIPILAYKKIIPNFEYPHNPVLFNFSIKFIKSLNYITTVSESTKNDLIKYCKIESRNIYVVHNCVNPIFRNLSINDKKKLAKLFFPKSYNSFKILITGSLSYKNHSTSLKVIEILEKCISTPIQLVVLKSKNTPLSIDFKKNKLKNNPIIFENISNENLVELYNSVDCLLFPSHYEGFGVPVIESMACGTPVLISNISPLIEIANSSALICDNNDLNSYVSNLIKLISDKFFYETLKEKGIINSKNFAYKKFVFENNEIYDKLLNSINHD